MAFNKILLSDNVTELANVKSVVFKEAVNADVNIRPGCVGSASIEVEVYGTQATAVSAGDVVYYYQIDKNNVQTMIGEFICEPTIKTKTSYKFIAYDNAQKLNADFSQWLQANQSNFPMTVYALVSAACAEAGVTLGSSSWGLSTQSVQAFYSDGITCRDILSYAAEIGCCFVRCHADGVVYFDWYASNANTITPSVGTGQYAYKQDGLNYANFTTATLDRVAVHPSGEDDVAYIYPTAITSGNTIHIQNNLLLTGADAALYNAVAQNVYTVMSALGTYRPMTASLFAKENPFRAGDIVSVTDAQSVTFTSIITGMTVSNSGAVLESTGNETYDEGTNNTQKAITQLASDVVRINKLKVDWAEINTAIINYLTANDVTAQNLTIVDASNNVLATFNANGITLGQSSSGHAFIDFNSFELYDADGNIYASFGDLRDASGIASVVETIEKQSSGSTITVNFPITSIDSITVNGTAVSNYTFNNKTITFSSSLAANDVVVVNYKTASPVYHYDLGSRANGSGIGAFSTSFGENQTASGYCSSANGGQGNTASGKKANVSGGTDNTANGENSGIVGGYNNTTGAFSPQSFIGGGSYNNTGSNNASVVGGVQNKALNVASFVGGGQYNEATGADAAVVGGIGNKANHKSQFVFGEYNELDNSANYPSLRGNYVEIVGNGTADNARSNARTLDWSGNETLSGGLTLGTPLAVASGGTGVTNTDALLSSLVGNLKVDTFRIVNNSGTVITFSGASRGAIIIVGAAQAGRELVLYGVNANGTVGVTRLTNASSLAITTATNRMQITNTSGADMYLIHLKYIV